jgi:hypothetical protein
MVLAFHVIFGVYGFWLPNDPRGSWSNFVGAWELFRFGPATKVETRVSLAQQPHDRAARRAAKESLKHPAVHLTGVQARAVSRGFAASARKGGVTVLACANLPEHVHLVLARHRCKVEWIVNQLKGGRDAPAPGGTNCTALPRGGGPTAGCRCAGPPSCGSCTWTRKRILPEPWPTSRTIP